MEWISTDRQKRELPATSIEKLNYAFTKECFKKDLGRRDLVGMVFPLPSRSHIYESTSMPPVNDPPIAPVTVEWGSFETLGTVSALARCLLRHWPDDTHSEAYVTALMVCEAVLAGSEDDTADDARASFVAAAHEAGLSVSPDDAGPDWF